VLLASLLAGPCFALAGPAIARRLPPRHATWLLSAGGAVAALGALAVLLLLASLLIGQQSEVAEEGQWSALALRAHAPVGLPVAAAGLLAALILVGGALTVGARRGRAVLAAHRACRELPGATGELVVIPGSAVGAYAVPGRPGRIVVGQSLISALSPSQRRALLAHERAHLTHGHHWHVAAVTVAAAINPFLFPLRDAVEHQVERWADEAAAAALGDRRVVAAAVTRAALGAGKPPAGALAAAAHAVPLRVAALLAPPPRARPGLVAMAVTLQLAGVAAVAVATKQTEHLFEFARHAESAARLR
jgi:hypothetical protein